MDFFLTPPYYIHLLYMYPLFADANDEYEGNEGEASQAFCSVIESNPLFIVEFVRKSILND